LTRRWKFWIILNTGVLRKTTQEEYYGQKKSKGAAPTAHSSLQLDWEIWGLHQLEEKALKEGTREKKIKGGA